MSTAKTTGAYVGTTLAGWLWFSKLEGRGSSYAICNEGEGVFLCPGQELTATLPRYTYQLPRSPNPACNCVISAIACLVSQLIDHSPAVGYAKIGSEIAMHDATWIDDRPRRTSRTHSTSVPRKPLSASQILQARQQFAATVGSSAASSLVDAGVGVRWQVAALALRLHVPIPPPPSRRHTGPRRSSALSWVLASQPASSPTLHILLSQPQLFRPAWHDIRLSFLPSSHHLPLSLPREVESTIQS